MRHDYGFPFRIDATSRQAAQATYPAHVDQMIRQVLLTAPGERTDLPEFGCGVRQLLFAPNADALAATAQLVVQQALARWLGDQISVQKVSVSGPEDPATDNELLIRIDYLLRETQTAGQTEVRVIG